MESGIPDAEMQQNEVAVATLYADALSMLHPNPAPLGIDYSAAPDAEIQQKGMLLNEATC